MQWNSAQAVMAHLAAHPVRHLIDGELVDSAVHAGVINPATGEACGSSPQASRAQLEHAVAAALRAQKAWAQTSFDERRTRLKAFADLLRSHAAELGALVTLEQGRPLTLARGEIERAASLLEAVIGIELGDEVLRADARGKVYFRFHPLGVVGAIAPWNVPVGLAVPKITHALYAGNTVVLKPSPYTPLATLRLGELARDLFPSGVLNIIGGGNEIGEAIATHPDIAKISFTGSVPTGRRVMASAAGRLKRLTLELGGNDAAIVREDADIERIAPQLFAAAFVNSGQVCMAIKRLYVHESLHDRLAALLCEQAASLVVGDGFDPATAMGPVQNLAQFESVKAVLRDVRADPKARVLTGGYAREGCGYFIEPTVVAGLAEGTRLVDQETFGPVLPILSYQTDEEAVQRANAGEFGLGASVWGEDLGAAEAMARQLVAGTVWINRHVGVDPLVPFGGAKSSGIGQQFGLGGLRDFMQPAAIYVPS
ncbi:acyl-CoA reductase-like NAD-dependent aldehyde dehydrogenase [Paraburkholderia unamae]|uniref:aldehyde dehydrogenase family protein n=1 Tax=Paraburkholderia unamae TaxID=219649 RepID=UPI000DC40B8F|nr:aldehyde dehydrogenase family protein [Paraburkholderia unamae]RAR59248.1 acyl-CoA reductase-like NAD-dependent aldehyde dehydrogenase [Paraburkholderia unamae]